MSVDEMVLQDVTTGGVHRVVPQRLVIAGFTGREQATVEAHLDELRALGATVPDATPVFMQLAPKLLTTAAAITVDGSFTSGEVEPVVVVTGQTWLLAVGSDHTDRTLERESISRSKAACPKIVGKACVPVDVVEDWDAVQLVSWANGDPDPYQSGSLGALLPLDDFVGKLGREGIRLGHGDVLFLGTVPVIGGNLRQAGRFRGELRVPDQEHVLVVEYRITVAS